MKNSFFDTLYSESGHSNHQEKLEPYRIFIGSWTFDWIGHNEDGSTWTVPGEWHFSWILEGRAIQDNWICPKRSLRLSGEYPDGEYGTTIRYYDFNDNCIKILWIGPILSKLNIFSVVQRDDEIVQNEIFPSDQRNISRWIFWIFKDIQNTSFKWESLISKVQCKTWKLDQEVFAKRMK